MLEKCLKTKYLHRLEVVLYNNIGVVIFDEFIYNDIK